jgi:ATP adenylyltransferase
MEKLWAPWRMQYIEKSLINDDSDCIFCTSSDTSKDKGKLVLCRGKNAFVMMNKFPYNNGHLLIAPYRHIGDFPELTDAELLDMQKLLGLCIKAIKASMHPQGFNIGVNLGRVAGAGVEDHVHYHLVPRWSGDTSFLPIFGEVKVISEALDKTYDRLKEEFDKLTSEQVSK